jgi:hypothetical protein
MVETPRRHILKEDASNDIETSNINTPIQIINEDNSGNSNETNMINKRATYIAPNILDQKNNGVNESPYLKINNTFYEIINNELRRPITNIRIQAELFKNMIEIMITTDRSKFKKVMFRFRRMIKKRIIDGNIFKRLKVGIITAIKKQLGDRWTEIMEDAWGQMCDKVLLFIKKNSNLDR